MTRFIVGAARLAARVTASFAMAFTVGTLAGCATGHAPAASGTPWLPAQASQVMHAAAAMVPQRPMWNGRGTWPDNGVEALCPAADAGHVATVGAGAHRFTVTCERDGRQFAWSVITGGAR
jgi:hypothetical protein